MLGLLAKLLLHSCMVCNWRSWAAELLCIGIPHPRLIV